MPLLSRRKFLATATAGSFFGNTKYNVIASENQNEISSQVNKDYSFTSFNSSATVQPSLHLIQSSRAAAATARNGGTSKVVVKVVGDSTGLETGNNNIAPGDNLFGQLKFFMRRANPGVIFDQIDRSIGGQTWQALAGTPAGRLPSWYVNRQEPWLDRYVAKNEQSGELPPDAIFISMGTNNGSTESASCSIDNFVDVFTKLASKELFPTAPDIILISNKGGSYPSQPDDQIGYQQVSSLIRSIAYTGVSQLIGADKTGGLRSIGLIDLGRYDTIARIGYDPCNQYLERALTNQSGATGSSSSESYNLPSCYGDFDLTVIFPNAGPSFLNDRSTLFFKVGGSIVNKRLTSLFYIVRNGDSLASRYSAGGKAPGVVASNKVAGMGDVTVRITARQELLTVALNGTVVIDQAVIRVGGTFQPGIYRTGATESLPFIISSYNVGFPVRNQPWISNLQAWGTKSGANGNGINHASSLGIATIEKEVLSSIDFRLGAL